MGEGPGDIAKNRHPCPDESHCLKWVGAIASPFSVLGQFDGGLVSSRHGILRDRA